MSLSVTNSIGGGSIGAVENLLVPSLSTSTINGVTCTNNGDGTYTLNGTASADTTFELSRGYNIRIGSRFKLVGCPQGGSRQSYRLFFRNADTQTYLTDIGDGVISEAGQITNFNISINSGTVCNNLVFKPMLTESLLPEYVDFVKGVESGLTPSMLGCTKMAIDTYTFASTTAINVGIPHSLGVAPKYVFIFSYSTTLPSYPSYLIEYYGRCDGNSSGGTTNGYMLYSNNGSWAQTTRTFYNTATTIISNASYYYWLTGTEYTIITMA